MTADHRPELLGKFACRLCGHDQYEHNLIVGCPHCRCAATPGEAAAVTDADMDRRIRAADEEPLYGWQANPVPTEETLRAALHDAVAAQRIADARYTAAAEALTAFLDTKKESTQ